jgi:Flp pilus assembly protein TadG
VDARHAERGQATVELALVLPVLLVVLGGLAQSGLVVVDQVRLWNAAREAARVAVVDPARHAASLAVRRAGVEDAKVDVLPAPEARRRGDPLTVTVSASPQARVPVVGRLFDGVTLEARATMRIERP